MFRDPAVANPPAANSQRNGKPKDLSNLKDDQLLARFFKSREDAAFAALVERYGPLVYGVCRRILTDSNDAEDAFQATFLVLVRKGATLREPGKLASWLYGVAYRTARKLKAKAALRTKSERQASEMPTKSDPTKKDHSEMTYEELQAILDEEISQLPEKYALPLVLCYLEGKTNAQAAKQLGWPEGSISRRLSRARELLRSRLARRGLAMSVALITAVFARPAVASVSRELLAATTRAATLAAEGVSLEELVSPANAKVINDIVAGMSAASRFTIPTILAVASILLVISTAIWQFGSPLEAAHLIRFNRGAALHALPNADSAASLQHMTSLHSIAEGDGAACAAPTVPVAATSCSAPAP